MDINNLCPHCMREIKEGKKERCPYCGKNSYQMDEVQHQLKPYTILQGKYLVGSVLGEGGFGITYVGLDINLEIRVAIKEFYPNGYATRESNVTTEITAYSGQSSEVVYKWRDNFLKEARSLAKCSHLPGVVGVKDFFQENNTAYIVQEYLEGVTLKEYANSLGGRISADELLPAIKPVLMALGEVHKQGLIHRDISPDNIMLLKNGQMKLLDFGAARDFTNEGEKSLSVLLKPGYAPEEQYRTKGNQGPWSDIYAFAGTIYKCLTGQTPPESMERMRHDDIQWPSQMGIAISPHIEMALMKAMEVFAEKRYQSVEEFCNDLYNIETKASQIPLSNPLVQSQQDMNRAISNIPVNTPVYTTTNDSVNSYIHSEGQVFTKSPTLSDEKNTGSTQIENKKDFDFMEFVKKNVFFFAIGGAALLLIIIAIVLIVAVSKKQEKESEKLQETAKTETRSVVENTEEELIEEDIEEDIEETDYIDDIDNITDEEYLEFEEEIEILPEEETIDCPRCGKKILVNVPWKVPAQDDELNTQIAETGRTPLEYYNPDEHDYQIFCEDITWEDAKLKCEQMGGHLATITCREEIEKIESYLYAVGADQPEAPFHIWWGAKCQGCDVNGLCYLSPVTYGELWGISNWYPGEPTHFDPQTYEEELYISMVYMPGVCQNGDWVWLDVPNDISYIYSGRIAYLCEWEHVLAE